MILADLAVTNGADREWMDLLQQQNLLKTLYAYAGWNTAANAAGCCIAQGMLCGKDSTQSALFTCHRILEDWLYMSLVRRDVAAYAQRKGLSFDGSWKEQLLAKYVTRQMCRLAKGLSLPAQVEISQISFPWHRPFEIELFIQLSAPSKRACKRKSAPQADGICRPLFFRQKAPRPSSAPMPQAHIQTDFRTVLPVAAHVFFCICAHSHEKSLQGLKFGLEYANVFS